MNNPGEETLHPALLDLADAAVHKKLQLLGFEVYYAHVEVCRSAWADTKIFWAAMLGIGADDSCAAGSVSIVR
jgi:hypothetical protein